MKLLLYSCKAKPYLNCDFGKDNHEEYSGDWNIYLASKENECSNIVNGKIVAECDFEVEKIRKGWGCLNGTRYFRNNVNHYYPDYELEKQSCLSFDEIDKYLKGTLNENCGYAIHIKNLHIFDEPRELGKTAIYNFNTQYIVDKAPQNMMKVYNQAGDCHILISIHPEWLCKILNREKTIEVRKKVLKEMIKCLEN